MVTTKILQRSTTYNYDNLAGEIKSNIQLALEEAKKHLMTRKLKNKINYDRNINNVEIKPDDLILIKSQVKSSKFDKAYHGPYRVINVTDPYLTIMRKGKASKIHKNLVKKAVAIYTNEPPHSFPIINLNDEEKIDRYMTQYIKRIRANRFKFF